MLVVITRLRDNALIFVFMACAGKPNICGGFKVANHKSALKRHKQSLQRAGRNRAARTRVKNAIKQVRAAIQNKEQGQASEALSNAASVLAKAAGKGALHWKKVARKISRLAHAVNGISAA